MNTKTMQIRALDKKIAILPNTNNIISPKTGWIQTVRETLGLTAKQLAKRLNISQPRITKIESNEENLKLSTMKKVAQAMSCEFVYYFKPKESFKKIIEDQAKKKAQEILQNVNISMSLEQQSIFIEDYINDIVTDLINNNIKKIWE